MNIVWLKRDLRIQDHGPIFTAASTEKIVVIYVFEPNRMAEPDYGANHHAFIVDSLLELQESLKSLNISLVYFVGEVVDVLAELTTVHKSLTLHSHIEIGGGWTYKRDKQVKKWCKVHQVTWIEYPIFEVQRPSPNRDDWAKGWKSGVLKSRYPTPPVQHQDYTQTYALSVDEPPLSEQFGLGRAASKIQKGGRENGIEMWQSFLKTRGHNYRKEMSSPVTAFDSCSRLSPHLAWGTLSIREVYKVATHAEHSSNLSFHHRKSLESFISRLHWRGHFMQKLEDQVEIEHQCMHPMFDTMRPRIGNSDLLKAWKEGRTGIPLLDACMRALVATGWLNFRMRAMIVSVACYNFWLDWREFRDWLACQFTDYEPGIHICQLQMQSGVTGINTIRMYNPYKQSVEVDPQGEFIKRWIPELSDIPIEYIHKPHEMPPLMRMMMGVDLADYPKPVVDIEQSAREAKAKVFAIKKLKEAKEVSQEVFQRHGSRRKR